MYASMPIYSNYMHVCVMCASMCFSCVLLCICDDGCIMCVHIYMHEHACMYEYVGVVAPLWVSYITK